jgi:hypothetical protein
VFSNDTEVKSILTSGSAFVNQNSVTVYEEASSQSPEVSRLRQGAQISAIDSADALPGGWRYIRAGDGTHGYIKDNTRVLTLVQVRSEYDTLRGGIKLGWAKIATGTALSLAGGAVSVLSLMRESGPGIIWYGAILVGLGQIGWGIEQLAFTSRALKQFDEVWKDMIS